MKRSRPTFPVGAGATDQAKAIKPRGAVAEGATGNVSEKELELSLGYDPLLGDDLKELEVKIPERTSLPCHRDHQTDHIQE